MQAPRQPTEHLFPHLLSFPWPRPEGQVGKAFCDTTRHSLFLSPQLTSCNKQRVSGWAGNEPVNVMPNPMVAGAPWVGGSHLRTISCDFGHVWHLASPVIFPDGLSHSLEPRRASMTMSLPPTQMKTHRTSDPEVAAGRSRGSRFAVE